jgi:hypothetical protein
VRTLWWSCQSILVLGLVRTFFVMIEGIGAGNTATIVVNAVLLPLEVGLVAVLWRLREQP